MAEFIDFEVSVQEQNEKYKEDEVSDDDLDSLKSFIDDSEVENDRTFYQQFENVSNSIDDILKDDYDKSMVKLMILRTVKKEQINLKKLCFQCLAAKMIIATYLLMQYFMQ